MKIEYVCDEPCEALFVSQLSIGETFQRECKEPQTVYLVCRDSVIDLVNNRIIAISAMGGIKIKRVKTVLKVYGTL